MEQWVGEIVAGIVLVLFAFSFRGWATTVKDTSQAILAKLELLVTEFHEHRVHTENRVTRVETKMEQMEKND